MYCTVSVQRRHYYWPLRDFSGNLLIEGQETVCGVLLAESAIPPFMTLPPILRMTVDAPEGPEQLTENQPRLLRDSTRLFSLAAGAVRCMRQGL